MADCQHRIDKTCNLGSHAAKYLSGVSGLVVPCEDDAEKACAACKCPYTLNYVSASLTAGKLCSETGTTLNDWEPLKLAIRSGPLCKRSGPGTWLSKIMTFMKIRPDPECDCEMHALTMDYWGSAICREKVDEIVGWLEAEAKKRNWSWVFTRVGAASLVALCCDLDEGLSWQEALLHLARLG